jgi:hypothetical protein
MGIPPSSLAWAIVKKGIDYADWLKKKQGKKIKWKNREKEKEKEKTGQLRAGNGPEAGRPVHRAKH